METHEKIRVYVNVKKGKTICICKASTKRCKKKCELDVVTRDKFYEWEDTFHRDKYGK